MANVINLDTEKKLKAFLSKKSGLAKQISETYVEAAKQDILDTMPRLKHPRQLGDLEKTDDEWLIQLIALIIKRASETATQIDQIALNYIKPEYQMKFRPALQKSLISGKRSFIGQTGVAMDVKVELGGNEQDDEKIAKFVAIVYNGGLLGMNKLDEYLTEDGKGYIVNAARNFDMKEAYQVANDLRDYFIKQHWPKIEEKFGELLKEEFKDGK
jgi:hypothetical protein